MNVQDYVFVYGVEWPEELLYMMASDPDAEAALIRYGVTLDDVRTYYLSPAHFPRVYAALIESGDDPLVTPVELLIVLIALEKGRTQHTISAAR